MMFGQSPENISIQQYESFKVNVAAGIWLSLIVSQLLGKHAENYFNRIVYQKKDLPCVAI
jgi:hypothetical protein